MGSQKSKTTLEQEANSILNPNTQGLIDAAEHRDLVLDLIASFFSIADNSNDVGLKKLDTSASYKKGQSVIHLGSIWRAVQDVPAEAFDEAKWELIAGHRTRIISSDHTVSDDDHLIIVDTVSATGTVDVTLPPTSDAWTEDHLIKVLNVGGSQNVRLLPSGSDTINGANELQLTTNMGRADVARFASGDWRTINLLDTDDLKEGSSNLYFTAARAVSALTGENISILNNDAGYVTEPKKDNAQNSLVVSDWVPTEWLDATLFSMTEYNTVASSEYTSIVGAGIGSKTIVENYLVAGKKILVRARGTISLGSGDNVELRFSIGSATIDTGTLFGSLTPSNRNFEIEIDAIARGSNSVYAIGFIRVVDGNGNESVGQIPGTPLTVDYGTDNLVDVLARMSNPTNDSLTCEMYDMSKKA